MCLFIMLKYEIVPKSTVLKFGMKIYLVKKVSIESFPRLQANSLLNLKPESEANKHTW